MPVWFSSDFVALAILSEDGDDLSDIVYEMYTFQDIKKQAKELEIDPVTHLSNFVEVAIDDRGKSFYLRR